MESIFNRLEADARFLKVGGDWLTCGGNRVEKIVAGNVGKYEVNVGKYEVNIGKYEVNTGKYEGKKWGARD